MALIIYSIIIIGYLVAFFLLFPKANRKAWEGLIPGYNFFVVTKIIERPWWWVLLLILPGVNILMLMVLNSHLATVFGKRELGEQAFAVLLPFIAFPIWAKDDKLKYIGQIDRTRPENKKSTIREWGDAIVFAVVAASIIRTYFLEAFTIPTGSMEKSLLIGDFLFVSKAAYGPKVPQTPLSFPFFHHSIPTTTIPSYLEWIKLPYNRLPGLGEVERNDIVVFNYPEGDTVLTMYQSTRSYEQVVRDQVAAMKNDHLRAGQPLKDDAFYDKFARKVIKQKMDWTVRPVDKREHYIKRCVAVPGDELFIEGGKLMINGETAYIPPHFQYNYNVLSTNTMSKEILKEKLNVNYADSRYTQVGQNLYQYTIPLTIDKMELMESFASVEEVDIAATPPTKIEQRIFFPNSSEYDWTPDFFGPITIPAEGTTIELTTKNLPTYSRIIHVYEGHDLKVDGEQIYIDGQLATSYTFGMDYYFMMGDNRHNSADSRFWGFVPEDHIVGEAAFIWLSLDPDKGLFDGKIRFDRMFSIPE